MASDFDDELNRGKAKIADKQKAAELHSQEMNNRLEAEKRKALDDFNLHEFIGLKSFPTNVRKPENIIFQRFVSEIKNNLPKVIPYVVELKIKADDKHETSQSDWSTRNFGEYLYTEFKTSATLRIPSFAPIEITWKDKFNREVPATCESVKINFSYSGESDWDVALVKAKEQYESQSSKTHRNTSHNRF